VEHWRLLIAILAILIAAFLLNKLWTGVLAAIFIMLSESIMTPTNQDIAVTAMFNGLIISAELVLLLFGAYLFYNVLSTNNHFKDFGRMSEASTSGITLMLILCWFIGSFMEGIAGFGIPAMLVGPLMYIAGFKALTCIVIPLAANTTAVTFGALGTPVKIGLGISAYNDVALFTALLNILPAAFMPFILTYMFGKTEQIKINWRKEWRILAGAAMSFIFPYCFTAMYSVEFPSVVGGGLGLFLFISVIIPKQDKLAGIFRMNLLWPYVILILLLLTGRQLLFSYSLQLHEGLRRFPAFQPGLVFILVSLLVLYLKCYSQFRIQLIDQVRHTFQKIAKPILTITLLVFFAQLAQNDLTILAQQAIMEIKHGLIPILILAAGTTGSFITGSATMSNLLLNQSIHSSYSTENYLYLSMALLHCGSCIGNAISFQNILMVKSVIRHPISIAKVLRYNLPVVIICLLLVLLSFLMIYKFEDLIQR
jgi:lactate permease